MLVVVHNTQPHAIQPTTSAEHVLADISVGKKVYGGQERDAHHVKDYVVPVSLEPAISRSESEAVPSLQFDAQGFGVGPLKQAVAGTGIDTRGEPTFLPTDSRTTGTVSPPALDEYSWRVEKRKW